ncbi:MAG: DUF2268 domain-containing putative Zn-dependent protease [Anaerolineales bacterium]
MRITDLTESYLRYVIQQDHPARYEADFPELFEHYYTFWAQPQAYAFRDSKQVIARRDLLLERLPLLAERFERNGLEAGDIDVVIFVGHGTSNGHAFHARGRWTVWLPLETYGSSQAVDIFGSHEIAHALHYQQQPDFYFKDEKEKNQVFRQLVTEGIATLISKEILGLSDEQALWADYLPFEHIQRWYAACRKRERELFRLVADTLPYSDKQNPLFSFSPSEDVSKNRAGYYVGLVLIERYARRQGLGDLFAISKEEFWQFVKGELYGTLYDQESAAKPIAESVERSKFNNKT